MTPLAVVKDFNIVLDDCLSLSTRLITLAMDHLVFQAAPEAFHRRVQAKLLNQLTVVMRIVSSYDWQDFLKTSNLQARISRRRNCHDNTVAESFFNCRNES